MDGRHLVVALAALPVAGAVLAPAVAAAGRRAAAYWSMAVAALTSAAGLALVFRAASGGTLSYHVGGWEPPFGIELVFDRLAAFAVVVGLVGFLVLAFSGGYAEKKIPPGRVPYFHALMLLNMAGMTGFAVAGDLFNLFVFMEILSLSSYALVAMSGETRAELAAFRYLVMGAVSSLWVLLGIGYLYGLTGTLNMADMAARLEAGVPALPAGVAFASLVLGFSVKAALFPVHFWLPEAHSLAPGPVSAVLSGLVVKAGVLGVLRTYQVFNGAGVLDTAGLGGALCWLGAVSLLMGAFLAVIQDDIKTMLAYSTVSNIGYMFMGLGLGSRYGVTGAVVHMFNHAVIKATLFLGAAAMIYRTGFRTLTDLRGAGRAMPLTSGAMTLGVLSIVGIPPTAGFLGKWYVGLGALEAGRPLFAAILALGALLIVIYYLRMINAFYFREPVRPEILSAGDAPPGMLAPLLAMAGLCLAMAAMGRLSVAFLQPAVDRLLAVP